MFLETLFKIASPFTYGDSPYTYHYTDGNALLSILEAKQLWASSGFFMNDSTEFKYIDSIMQDAINMGSNHQKDSTKLFFHILEQEYHERIRAEIFDPHKTSKFFILSFSDDPDSQILWSSYTQNQGYSIAIDKMLMAEKLCEERSNKKIHNFYLGDVIYDREKQIEMVFRHFCTVSDVIDEYHSSKQLTLEMLRELTAYMQVMIETLSLFFKDPLFHHEKEFRLAVLCLHDHQKARIKYRVSKNVILPYLPLDLLSDSSTFPIVGLKIGPTNKLDLSRMGLIEFCTHKGLEHLVSDISHSEVPLRF